ncbi:MAG: CxxC-x17-CxxC domain-containing protein [Candidatus Gracilibacteria bacterium]
MYKKFDKEKRPSRDRELTLYEAECAECGDRCEVPFRPTGNRPVFCRDCFRKQENEGEPRFESRGRSDRQDRFDRPDRSDRQDRSEKRLYSATCSSCQSDCEVPFKPTFGRPVYCHRCMGAQNSPMAQASTPASTGSGFKISEEQFKTLNAKMDKILRILELATQDMEEDDMLEEVDEAPAEAPAKKKAAAKKEPAAKKKPTRAQVKRAERTGRA